jgi:peptide-methionine (S)-S-oxide reductase
MASCDLAPGRSIKDFPAPSFDPAVAAERASIVLAGGCFWCVEAVFQAVEGVTTVTSGYAGGTAETADYRTVCSGNTDHAEVVQLDYNPQVVSLGTLLKLFFSVAHNPTQLNRQGNDSGRQYRSAVFYADEQQRDVALRYIEQLEAAKLFNDPIVTTLEPLTTFYRAEDYHQNYASQNPYQPYIQGVAAPKVRDLLDNFADEVKKT